MARRRNDAPQSNMALIIFLVFSVLLNLGLGVWLYMSQAKIDEALKSASDAKTAQTGAESQRQAMETQLGYVRLLIGDNSLTAEEKANLESKITGSLTIMPQPWMASLQKDVVGTPGVRGLAGDGGKLTGNLALRIRTAENERINLSKTLNDLKIEVAKIRAEAEQYKKDWNAQKQTDALAAAQKAFQQDLTNKLKQKDDVIAEVTKKLEQVNLEVEKQLADNKKKYDDSVKAITMAAEDRVKRVEEERREEKFKQQQSQIVNLNVPKGKVISLLASGDLAHIDLGTDNQVPVGLTFAVHGRDAAGKPLPNPKAEVEVITLMGKNMSTVRIKRIAKASAAQLNLTPEDAEYWVTNSADFLKTSSPLLPGDLLYNAVWDSSKRFKIALTGDVDIDGDGLDDTQALIRILANQNVDVVYYLDRSANYAPRGRLDYSTDYLVIGGIAAQSRSELKAAPANSGTDMIRATEKTQREASEKGITTISLNRFLLSIGLTPAKMGNAPAATAPAAPAVEPGAAAPPAGGAENK